MRILVVEDEKRLNRIISEALEDEGYSVDSCLNGLDALDYAAGTDYDVIILDIMMPKMDGLEVVRRLRAGGRVDDVDLGVELLQWLPETAWPIGWPGWKTAGTITWSSPLIFRS